MELSAENLRYVLGLKLRRLRLERGLSLKELAARSGLAISYLSEIEKGKKYPKPGRLLDLTRALEVPFDDLVSLRVEDDLSPFKSFLASDFLKEFPFELFGLEPEDLFELIASEPAKAGALIRTFAEIGQTYDVQVEHFLFSALRSYQQMHGNHFPELEESARTFRAERGWPPGYVPEAAELRTLLEQEFDYRIDDRLLPAHPDLCRLRSIYVDTVPPRLFLNGRLLAWQQAFLLARELGFQRLNHRVRALTSSWIKVESFEQVLANFEASYFAGAVLLERDSLAADLASFFALEKWDGKALLALMHRYHSTPEMLFHRLTQVVPRLFGLEELFFLRLNHEAGGEGFHLTKVLNLSRAPVPHGVGAFEHYCRRWPPIQLLREMDHGGGSEKAGAPLIGAERIRFLDEGAEFLVLTSARPLALNPGVHSAVALGLLVNDALERTVRFAADPALRRREVNLTCERCRLAPEECAERAAAPALFLRREASRRREEAVNDLLANVRGGRLPARHSG